MQSWLPNEYTPYASNQIFTNLSHFVAPCSACSGPVQKQTQAWTMLLNLESKGSPKVFQSDLTPL